MPGPFYFAWVDATDNSFNTNHIVEDEDIFSFDVMQSEGDFGNLEIKIRNPRVGLLCAGRKQNAWLSWDNGSGIEPLFFGRISGVPDKINQELVSLVFTARPADFNSQKIALAATLKVAPYWDDIFIDDAHRDDPDAVLEARSQLWHGDRVTHELTVSDIITGEDGLETFSEDEIVYESVDIQIKVPVSSVSVDASVGWSQPASGSMPYWNGHVIKSFTGDGLLDDWPKPTSRLDGGWFVSEDSAAIAVPDIELIPDDRWVYTGSGQKLINGELVPPPTSLDNLPGGPVTDVPEDWLPLFIQDTQIALTHLVLYVLVPLWTVRGTLNFTYAGERKRIERIQFTLKSDIQDIITAQEDDDIPVLSINGANVDEPLPQFDSNTFPIGDPRRRSYFPLERGLQSVEYLISRARSRLLMGARCVEVSAQIPFERAVDLSCRKNALLIDNRLPGGQALGKVISYSFSVDGDSGQAKGSVVIGCAIGRGTSVTATDGEPSYIDDDYIDPRYQFHENQVVVVGGGNVGYTTPIDEPNDDGLNLLQPLNAADIITEFQVNNDSAAQRVQLFPNAHYTNLENEFHTFDTKTIQDQVKAILDAYPTTVSFTMKPVIAGPFTNVYSLSVTDLVIPRMIDLESCS